MAKSGEIAYLQTLGEGGARHAADKPFSDRNAGSYLIALGAIRLLLPPPPARVLELGCGTGWVGCLLAKMGYEVVGQDIAQDMIHLAHVNAQRYEVPKTKFIVSDYEEMDFDDPFDGAVFFDSLHHALDEKAALSSVYRSLRPGGICITHEPGVGHAEAEASQRAVRLFDVTEKDMPPGRIIALAQEIGFASYRVHPFAETLVNACLNTDPHQKEPPRNPLKRLAHRIRQVGRPGRRLHRMRTNAMTTGGLVILEK